MRAQDVRSMVGWMVEQARMDADDLPDEDGDRMQMVDGGMDTGCRMLREMMWMAADGCRCQRRMGYGAEVGDG